jgi:hypothetical protein
MIWARPSRNPGGAQKPHLSAQADGARSARHLDEKAFDPGHAAEAPERRDGLDFLEQRLHVSPGILGGTCFILQGRV